MHNQKTMIATNRFGLGARPGEAAQAASDPQAWLLAQLESKNASEFQATGLKPSDQAAREYFEFQAAKRKAKKEASAKAEGENNPRPGMNNPRSILVSEIEARTRFAVTTSNPFRERLVRFWSNHFTVSTTRNPVVPVAGAFEREAIRPHVTGSFFDMLAAVEMHSAMLLYLDNAQSVGPNSLGGKRRGRGLNENLAREILELHTVGVNGGYSQEDVTNFAKILTGWTIAGPRDRNPTGKTYFDERRHEPGNHMVMGKNYPELGGEQAVQVLKDLSMKPRRRASYPPSWRGILFRMSRRPRPLRSLRRPTSIPPVTWAWFRPNWSSWMRPGRNLRRNSNHPMNSRFPPCGGWVQTNYSRAACGVPTLRLGNYRSVHRHLPAGRTRPRPGWVPIQYRSDWNGHRRWPARSGGASTRASSSTRHSAPVQGNGHALWSMARTAGNRA